MVFYSRQEPKNGNRLKHGGSTTPSNRIIKKPIFLPDGKHHPLLRLRLLLFLLVSSALLFFPAGFFVGRWWWWSVQDRSTMVTIPCMYIYIYSQPAVGAAGGFRY